MFFNFFFSEIILRLLKIKEARLVFKTCRIVNVSILSKAKHHDTPCNGKMTFIYEQFLTVLNSFSSDTCFSDPGHCSENGMTVMSWINLNKTSLSDKTGSSYIMSSGGQSTASRGFAVVYMPKRYIVILSTKNKQWKLDTPVLPSGWFNLAFTWREAGQLKLYVNGTHVTSSNPALVFRPRDSFTTFDIGRPNNSDKLMYRFPLRISDLALWERDLSEQELKSG